MKASELEGLLLDYWAAKAEGLDPIMEWYPTAACVWLRGPNSKPFFEAGEYSPSTDWKLGGPIIHKNGITIKFIYFYGDGSEKPPTKEYWGAYYWKPQMKKEIILYDKDPLIAAMRVFVTSKFGEEVSDDEPEKM